MNGFNPLGGLKSWHIYGCAIFVLLGAVAAIIWTIKGLIWIINHVTITP